MTEYGNNSTKEKIELLEKELEKAREHIRKLKEEVTTQHEALERRNKEVVRCRSRME